MYLVRKGQLVVYLEDHGREVQLAKIHSGELIGEMALFDRKPRSAAVKAVKATEVTHITNEDFAKLLKQIPKWFVSLMGTLSTRLRVTNERLQALETGRKKGDVFKNVRKILQVLNLIIGKDAAKDGRDWIIERNVATQSLRDVFGEDLRLLELIVDVLIEHDILAQRVDDYKNRVLVVRTKSQFESFVGFLTEYIHRNPEQPYLSHTSLSMLEALNDVAHESPYDVATVDFEELQADGARKGLNTDDWKRHLPELKQSSAELKFLRSSSGGIGMRIEKKQARRLLSHHNAIAELFRKCSDLS